MSIVASKFGADVGVEEALPGFQTGGKLKAAPLCSLRAYRKKHFLSNVIESSRSILLRLAYAPETLPP